MFREETCDDTQKMFLKLACWGNIFTTSLIKENNIRFPSTLYEDGVFYLYSPKDSEKMFEPIEYDSEMNAARYAWGVILIPPAIALDIVLLPVYAVGGVLFGVLMASAW